MQFPRNQTSNTKFKNSICRPPGRTTDGAPSKPFRLLMPGHRPQIVVPVTYPSQLYSHAVPRRQPKARSLSIFLIKEEVPSPEGALVDVLPLTRSALTANGQQIGDLYIKGTQDRTPSWLSFFEGAMSSVPPDLHNASAAAVWLIGSGGRVFALTFGYGRSLLRPGTWDLGGRLRIKSHTQCGRPVEDPKRRQSKVRRDITAQPDSGKPGRKYHRIRSRR